MPKADSTHQAIPLRETTNQKGGRTGSMPTLMDNKTKKVSGALKGNTTKGGGINRSLKSS